MDKHEARAREIVMLYHEGLEGFPANDLSHAIAETRRQAEADALERAAMVAEEQYTGQGYHSAARNAGIGIATAIRNLKETESAI